MDIVLDVEINVKRTVGWDAVHALVIDWLKRIEAWMACCKGMRRHTVWAYSLKPEQ